jgi:hypothetical protein
MCRPVRRTMKLKARLESQMKLYKITVVPRAIYGCKTWTVRKNHVTRIQIAEMKFLHVVAADHLHNTDMREKQNYSSNWLQKLQRMEDYRRPKQEDQ